MCVLWGRQTGKSHGGQIGAEFLALQPSSADCAIIVITTTVDSVKRMAFEPAKRLIRDYCLPGRTTSRPPVAIFKNGCKIYYLGADDDDTIKRLRGTPNLIAVFIDEAGVYDPDTLREIIEAVVPGLRPRAGKLIVMGTPSMFGKQGTWYNITQNPSYRQYRALYTDNTKVPTHVDVEKLIDEELATLFPELTKEARRATAYFLREYMCEFVVDLEEKVYKLTDRNLVDALPMICQHYATGGDIGTSAADALVTIGWNDGSSDVWVMYQQAVTGQETLAFGRMIAANHRKFEPMAIVVDAGGLGGKAIETVQKIYPEIPLEAAVKPEIPIQVRAVNVLLAPGHLKMLRGSPLALQLARPTWPGGEVGKKIDENGPHSDLIPSLRYVCIKVAGWLPKPPREVERVNPHSEMYVDQLMAAQSKQQAIDESGHDQSGEEMPALNDYQEN